MKVTVWKHVNDREVTVTLDTNSSDLSHLLTDSGLSTGIQHHAWTLSVRLSMAEAYDFLEAWARVLLDPGDPHALNDMHRARATIRTAHPDHVKALDEQLDAIAVDRLPPRTGHDPGE